jgi:hypothetical protein
MLIELHCTEGVYAPLFNKKYISRCQEAVFNIPSLETGTLDQMASTM